MQTRPSTPQTGPPSESPLEGAEQRALLIRLLAEILIKLPLKPSAGGVIIRRRPTGPQRNPSPPD